jgi:hypothetical protein
MWGISVNITKRRTTEMSRFFIEIPHEEEKSACLRAVKVLQDTGSHFLTHADYGCMDGVHKAWIIVEVDSKNEAHMIVPRAYRDKAKIVKLNQFSVEEIDKLLDHHAD